ncbi:MAG: hypothetical protein MJY85_03435 [Fibrobacter sp.]|nr:hypothetical protein [Fibrobacter sp.]
MKNIKKLSLFVSVAALLIACGSEDSTNNPVGGGSANNSIEGAAGFLVDSRDGHRYKTVTIGTQTWMAENLNYAYLQPTADVDSSSFCYNDDPANCENFGRLYTWSAAMDSAGLLLNDGKGRGCGDGGVCAANGTVQGICPSGWRLPQKQDFEILIAFVQDSVDKIVAQKKQNLEPLIEGIEDAREHLKASVWSNLYDTFGFSALPSGRVELNDLLHLAFGSPVDLQYDGLGEYTYFWSSTSSDGFLGGTNVNILSLGNKSSLHIPVPGEIIGVESSGAGDGKSVRCLKK